ncbi:hypothetical protein D3C85_173450 [compost metagenome]
MAKEILALPQEVIKVGEVEYLVTAMSATAALQFMEKHLTDINEGKIDLSVIKQIVVKYVTKDNIAITAESFDVIFSRKTGHLQKLFDAVLKYNFEDVFQESGLED